MVTCCPGGFWVDGRIRQLGRSANRGGRLSRGGRLIGKAPREVLTRAILVRVQAAPLAFRPSRTSWSGRSATPIFVGRVATCPEILRSAAAAEHIPQLGEFFLAHLLPGIRGAQLPVL